MRIDHVIGEMPGDHDYVDSPEDNSDIESNFAELCVRYDDKWHYAEVDFGLNCRIKQIDFDIAADGEINATVHVYNYRRCDGIGPGDSNKRTIPVPAKTGTDCGAD